jgi:hypothetical protein
LHRDHRAGARHDRPLLHQPIDQVRIDDEQNPDCQLEDTHRGMLVIVPADRARFVTLMVMVMAVIMSILMFVAMRFLSTAE